MATCTEIVTPIVPIPDPCNGKYTSTDCIIFEEAIASLSLPTNSTVTNIIIKLAIDLQEARTRITTLETAFVALETRVTNLE